MSVIFSFEVLGSSLMLTFVLVEAMIGNLCSCDFFFFFKAEAANGVLRSLVGSEKGIRDSRRFG